MSSFLCNILDICEKTFLSGHLPSWSRIWHPWHFVCKKRPPPHLWAGALVYRFYILFEIFVAMPPWQSVLLVVSWFSNFRVKLRSWAHIQLIRALLSTADNARGRRVYIRLRSRHDRRSVVRCERSRFSNQGCCYIPSQEKTQTPRYRCPFQIGIGLLFTVLSLCVN